MPPWRPVRQPETDRAATAPPGSSRTTAAVDIKQLDRVRRWGQQLPDRSKPVDPISEPGVLRVGSGEGVEGPDVAADRRAGTGRPGVGGEDQSGMGAPFERPAPGGVGEVGDIVGDERALFGPTEDEQRLVVGKMTTCSSCHTGLPGLAPARAVDGVPLGLAPRSRAVPPTPQ